MQKQANEKFCIFMQILAQKRHANLASFLREIRHFKTNIKIVRAGLVNFNRFIPNFLGFSYEYHNY
jgi:hypothetical protein